MEEFSIKNDYNFFSPKNSYTYNEEEFLKSFALSDTKNKTDEYTYVNNNDFKIKSELRKEDTNENNEFNSDNVFLKRTFLNQNYISEIVKEYDYQYVDNKYLSHSEKITYKKNRTKYLLSKTRRNSMDLQNQNKINTDEEIIKNDDFYNKKEKLKQQNRESALKYRINKKKDMESLKVTNHTLQEEIKILKFQLTNISSKVNLVCDECKKLIKCTQKSSICNNNSSNNTIFNVHQENQLSSSTSNGVKYSLLTGLFAIVCIVNVLWSDSLDSSPSTSNFSPRSLAQSSEVSISKPFYNTKINDSLSEEMNNKSAQNKLIDYVISQSQNFTINKVKMENKNINLNVNANKEVNKELENNEICANYNTFLRHANIKNIKKDNTKFEFKPTKANTNIAPNKFLGESNSNSNLNEDLLCKYNTTSLLKAYFNFEFISRNNSKDENCKYCKCPNPDLEKQNKKNSDPLYFKMIIPVNDPSYTKDLNFSNSVSDLIFKKLNQKKSYYEIDCMILDINRLIK